MAPGEQGRAAESLLAQTIEAGPRVASVGLSGLQLETAGDRRMDFLSIRTDAAELVSAKPDQWIEAWLYCGNRPLIDRVVVDGQLRVADGQHRLRAPVESRYAKVAAQLRDQY